MALLGVFGNVIQNFSIYWFTIIAKYFIIILGFVFCMFLPNRIVSLEADGMSGKLEVGGEVWSFVSEDLLLMDDKVLVLDRESLILKVKKHRE